MQHARGPASWRCSAGSLGPGETATFSLPLGERRLACFIVNHEGQYHAYVNCCPHAGTPLDCWPNEFLSADRRHLICATHGAAFEPDTGLCVEGPCPGASLERLRVDRDGDDLVVTCAP